MLLSQDLFVAYEPDPEAGPVAVEIAYRVRPDKTAHFLEEVVQLRAPRKRDGATLADQQLEERLLDDLQPGELPTMQHYIAER